LVAELHIKHPRILREALAEPLIAIGPPEHHVTPPLVRRLMCNKGVSPGVGVVGTGYHDGGWETLSEVERMIHTSKQRIRILAKHLAEEADAVVHLGKN